jgi:type II secretory pathway pseudopilin PulG
MRFAKVHIGQGRPQAGGGRNTRQETRLTFRKRLATILSASALALATPLAAQQTPPPQIAAEEVTDAQVVAFVDAILAVDEVRKEYGPKIEEAERNSRPSPKRPTPPPPRRWTKSIASPSTAILPSPMPLAKARRSTSGSSRASRRFVNRKSAASRRAADHSAATALGSASVTISIMIVLSSKSLGV